MKTMQRLIEKHSVAMIFGILTLMVIGYVDMRSLFGAMNGSISNMSISLTKAVDLADRTRKEQLLRTDEISYVQKLRDHGTLVHIKKSMK